MWLVIAALAGSGDAARLVVDGEIVVARHTDGFCSWPRVQGVTTPVSGPLPEVPWDPVFDPAASLKGFTGMLRGDDPAIGAVVLDLAPTIARPSRDGATARSLLATCGLGSLEATSLVELLRKSPVPARASVLRALIAPALETKPCRDVAARGVLMAEALRCEAGACDEMVARLAVCR